MKMFDKTRELIREIITKGQLHEDLSELIYESEFGLDKVSLVYEIEEEEEDKKE
jgi:hypothetical protein